MIDRSESTDMIEASDAADPIEKADSAEPTEPIDRIEPTEPIDRMEPLQPMHRIESSDLIDHSEPEAELVIRPGLHGIAAQAQVLPEQLLPDEPCPHRGDLMARATWNATTIAESDDTVVVENNHYFPRSSVRNELLRESDKTSVCPWKGTASYLSIEVDGASNPDAAWYYPQPTDAAAQIKDHVAFWKGVEVTS